MSAGAFSDLFVEGAGRYAAEIVRAVRAADWEGLGRAAHQLKGSAALYGFHQVAAAAAMVELELEGSKGVPGVKPPSHLADSALHLARLCERAAGRDP